MNARRIVSVDQVADRYEVNAETGCWLWTGATKRDAAYGELYASGKTHRAHRWFYEQLVGLVPDGLELDHTCEVPLCVNPAHLEPVTHAENQRRAGTLRLTEDAVRGLHRRLGGWSDSLAAFARHEAPALGVSPHTIEGAMRGHTWRHLHPEKAAA